MVYSCCFYLPKNGRFTSVVNFKLFIETLIDFEAQFPYLLLLVIRNKLTPSLYNRQSNPENDLTALIPLIHPNQGTPAAVYTQQSCFQ